MEGQTSQGHQKNPFEPLFEHVSANTREVWEFIVGNVRAHYAMDEVWDGKKQLKFRKSGKTLLTLSLKSETVGVLIIFGKDEREKFEAERKSFSQFIQDHYDHTKTFHDGKWMFIDVNSVDCAREIVRLVYIKKIPNRR